MTDYAGESYRVASAPLDDDNETLLGPDDVASLTVSIWAPDNTLLVDEQAMAWDIEHADFVYHFDTSQDPGVYNIRVKITGLDARVNWEWQSLWILDDPVSVP